ncbi:peptide chain release factor 1 [Clostridium cylindrosporum]|uniref:Peptide chain release factor 1 n=1 Tax=Clostridium cylindrosporum DSM 605 TaxID=1121307 RepID=A0A0J8G560_CLOCY|nr:peptide chain release factor 1 [Clostridium cylindrosporum]KMT22801.1 peptide chain release factor 1 [Clostridium cylindrosporum DSM 605]
MLDKLDFIEEKYEELSIKISDPEVVSDNSLFQKLCKEHSSLEEIVIKYREYKDSKKRIEEDKEMLQDKLDRDMKELVEEELKELIAANEKQQEELKVLLLPKDPNDSRNVFVEIRGGAGGEEAALFASVLYRMYTRYAERSGWKTEIMSLNETGIGGFKEVVFMIKGHGAYSKLKYESGVHRVQRVPDTETSGRIHTSTATVAVLPEVDDVEIDINQNDIRVDVFRASGNGGQCVNTTDSAVRMTHVPTGIVVSCQDEKSQLKNKEKALKVLKARIYEIELEKQRSEIAKDRKSQVGTGDRSERIRTYNYPQGRITDHRIGLTIYRMEAFLDGDIEEAIEGLITADQAEKLKDLGE